MEQLQGASSRALGRAAGLGLGTRATATTPPRRRPPPALPSPAEVKILKKSVKKKPPALTASTTSVFKQIDTDESGTVSKAEARKYAEELGYEVDEAFIDGAWAAFDFDNSGELDEQEFMHFLKVLKRTDGAAGSSGYEVTGSGRLPGSKYSISEVEINDCATKAQLQKLVRLNKDTGRGGGGCFGCGKPCVLSKWTYLEQEALQQALADEFKLRDGLDSDNPTLEGYLGVKPADSQHAHNKNYFQEGDDEGNTLRFNRRLLINQIYDDEKPPFKTNDAVQKVKMEANPSDKEVDDADKVWLIGECRKRGFTSPPYQLHVEGDKGSHSCVIVTRAGLEDKDGVRPTQKVSVCLPFVFQ